MVCLDQLAPAYSTYSRQGVKKPKGNDNWDKDVKPDQHALRVIGLSKSLGGGACVQFQHADSGQEDNKSTALAL